MCSLTPSTRGRMRGTTGSSTSCPSAAFAAARPTRHAAPPDRSAEASGGPLEQCPQQGRLLRTECGHDALLLLFDRRRPAGQRLTAPLGREDQHAPPVLVV